jgi:hypothetical protein
MTDGQPIVDPPADTAGVSYPTPGSAPLAASARTGQAGGATVATDRSLFS